MYFFKTNKLAETFFLAKEERINMDLVPFDKRNGKIWLNGQMINWSDAKIHILSHGLHYASCVFEGERVYNGEIFKLREHTDRLFYSAETLGFKIPFSFGKTC